MTEFTSLIGNWHFWVLVASYWALSNAIGALPLPDPTSSKFYSWFFKFANGFAANLSRAAAGKIPGTDAMAQQQGAAKTP
jgi:hypothetical protein